jgi:hypothetical protein
MMGECEQTSFISAPNSFDQVFFYDAHGEESTDSCIKSTSIPDMLAAIIVHEPYEEDENLNALENLLEKSEVVFNLQDYEPPSPIADNQSDMIIRPPPPLGKSSVHSIYELINQVGVSNAKNLHRFKNKIIGVDSTTILR